MLKIAFLAGLGREEEAGIEIEGRLFKWQSWSQAAKAAEVLEVLEVLEKSWSAWQQGALFP